MIKQMLSEATEKRIDQIADRGDFNDLKFLAFDTETTGLHYYQGKVRSLNLKLPSVVSKELDEFYAQQFKVDKKEAHAVTRNLHSPDAELQLAEIAAVVFDVKGNEIDRFHEYITFDENTASEKVMRLIHWNDEKKKAGKDPARVLKSFSSFLKKHDKAIILAHNAPYDVSIITGLAKKFKILDLVSYIKSKSTVIVDTRKTTKLREVIKDILPTKTNTYGKVREDNVQGSIIKSLGIENKAAHTAIEDVLSLKNMFLKLIDLYRGE